MTHPPLPDDQAFPPNDDPAHGDGTETQDVNLSADLYTGKIKINAPIRSNEGQAKPETWAQVAKSFNQSLMRIVAGLPGVVAEALDGAIRICKGLASLPESLAERVRGAQDTVDRREAERTLLQSPEKIDVHGVSQARRTINPRDAEQALLDKIMRLQARGIPVQLQQRPDGVWIIVIVRPELGPTAHQLGKEAVDEHQNESLLHIDADRTKDHREFEKLLENIPDATDRQIARLWAMGVPSDTIAVELGLTAEIVRKRWSRIRDRLREILGGDAAGEGPQEYKPK